MPCKHLIITGRVQGVFYRESMRRKADSLGVTGWVRNHRNGSVEALVCGDTGQLEEIIHWTKRGPEMAEVGHVRVSDAEGHFDSFAVLPTRTE